MTPPPTRMDLSAVAARESVTTDTIRARVRRGEYPAPSRFTATGKPTWRARDLDAFDEGTHPAFTNPTDAGYRARHATARLLDEVRAWTWEHGTSLVPYAEEGRTGTLGKRVMKVRALYRDGGLTRAETADFEALPGWSWDGRSGLWYSRLSDLLTRWPDALTADDRAWLWFQRSRLDVMPPERVAALRDVPGLLDHRGNRRVDQFVKAMNVWLSAEPGRTCADLRVRSTAVVDGREVPVGKRAVYYRRRYAGKERDATLTPAEVAQIEALPGWDWQQSERHVLAAARIA